MQTNKRRCERIQYQQDVWLKTAAGLALLAKSNNLSAGGMEILCDQITAMSIKPLGYQLEPDKPLLLSISFCLDKGDESFHASCCVQNMHRLAQDLFSFNLSFLDCQHHDRARLARFINE
ncbi:MAG TPA: PilZ domain-containing protein [Cycloclasticus sp.]|jgi:c-di-GMP-binding flagellar brake protein YcgR|nr:PilZ domain-containing protein [Cycloclasticus sp.]HIL92918.1 PilZ domain-containing protein [Cycloclasticus sp.]